MGGLATALALAKKGFTDIQVYETASGLGFVGAGIQMAPNLVRILARLGCWGKVENEATDVMETSIRGACSPSTSCPDSPVHRCRVHTKLTRNPASKTVHRIGS